MCPELKERKKERETETQTETEADRERERERGREGGKMTQGVCVEDKGRKPMRTLSAVSWSHIPPTGVTRQKVI